jgi:hypothetical protein
MAIEFARDVIVPWWHKGRGRGGHSGADRSLPQFPLSKKRALVARSCLSGAGFDVAGFGTHIMRGIQAQKIGRLIVCTPRNTPL